MTTLNLYRMKVLRSSQRPLLGSDPDRPNFLRELLTRKPSNENKAGYMWHIGNVHEGDHAALGFAVGRTTTATRATYDEESGDFLEVDDEDSPFTQAIADIELSLLAIRPNARLAPTTRGIARNIEKLLNASPFTVDHEVRIEIPEISDPEGFIAQIHQAHAVVGFKMEFGQPNPFDVERDFHAPMEELLKDTGGQKGATQITGSDLDRTTLESLTRSVAASGNEASARIRPSAGDRPTTRHLKGDPVTVLVDELAMPFAAAPIITRVRETYNRVRQFDSDS